METSDISNEILREEPCWKVDTSRQRKYPSQKDTETIFLRAVEKPYPPNYPRDTPTSHVHPSRETKLATQFPVTMEAANAIAARLGGELCRVMLVRLKPGGHIPRHADQGDYFRVRHRFHLMINAAPGALFQCGDETIPLEAGLLFWFDNKALYEEFNRSTQWSTWLVVDVLPPPLPPNEPGAYRNFSLLESQVNVAPLLQELDAKPELWLRDTSRQDRTEVQRETNNIMLRGSQKPLPEGVRINDVHPSRDSGTVSECPVAYVWLQDWARKLQGDLCRAIIVRLNPNGHVYPHTDGGEYYKMRDRYHLVLRSPGGSEMICGGERVVFNDGELWWFNNKAPHEASNPSDQGRIHLIFDLLPFKPRAPLFV